MPRNRSWRLPRVTGQSGYGAGGGPLAIGAGRGRQGGDWLPAGGVPPIGHRQPLQVVIDRRVFDHDVVYGGGGDEWHMLRLEPRVIQRLTGARVADVVEESTADPAGGTHA